MYEKYFPLVEDEVITMNGSIGIVTEVYDEFVIVKHNDSWQSHHYMELKKI